MSSARFPVSWMKRHYLMSLCSIVAAFAFILAGCSDVSTTTTTTTTTSNSAAQGPGAYGLAALPGYSVSLFARQPSNASAPDSLVVDGSHVFID